MGFWHTNAGGWFRTMISPALWSATRQQFASDIIDNNGFVRTVKADFLRGRSDSSVAHENDGGFLLEVVGSTPTGGSGSYRVLADKDDYGGLNPAHGFRNRYVIVMGSFVFLDTPSHALPGGSSEGLLISNLLGSDGGETKPIVGTWYTGGGLARPVDGGSTRAFQKSGTYHGGDEPYNLVIFAGAEGSEDEGRLVLFEDAAHGAAIHLVFLFGPRCEYAGG